MLCAFEGLDGVGKTTIANGVAAELLQMGHRACVFAFPGRTPRTLGALVYDLHHNPAKYDLTGLRPDSLQLLHVAAHLETIYGPIARARSEGAIVLLDRFWWSTRAYGAAAGLADPQLKAILSIELDYWRAAPPDLVFLVSRQRSGEQCVSPPEVLPLETAYRALVDEEHLTSRIVQLQNDGDVEEAVTRVVAEITRGSA